MRIRCDCCGGVMDESAVEDVDGDQCPDCGTFTSFEELDGVGSTCSECGGEFEDGELESGQGICFYCQTGEPRDGADEDDTEFDS